jgi:hypothetical protein
METGEVGRDVAWPSGSDGCRHVFDNRADSIKT